MIMTDDHSHYLTTILPYSHYFTAALLEGALNCASGPPRGVWEHAPQENFENLVLRDAI